MEGAHTLLQQVVNVDQWTPAYQRDFLMLLQERGDQKSALMFVEEHPSRSVWHTGFLSTVAELTAGIDAEIMTPPVPTQHAFENLLAFVGHSELPQTVAPGNALNGDFYWQALQPISEDFIVSIHLRRQGMWPGTEMIEKFYSKLKTPRISSVVSYHIPLQRAYATSNWLPGEYVRDPYSLALPQHLTPGHYAVYLEVLRPLDRKPVGHGNAQKAQLGEILITE
jgi:hypothetical protein